MTISTFFDTIKLDMKFLDGGTGGRGGVIVGSVMQMARWLGLPVIAEGVETPEQAEYLKGIGCGAMQGFLYFRPMPGAEFKELLQKAALGKIAPPMDIISTMDAGKFWDPESLEALIFSSYVGGAAILSVDGERAEYLRINEKYIQEIGNCMPQDELLRSDPFSCMLPESQRIFKAALSRAVETKDEQECETWREYNSKCCGDSRLCIRSTLRMIGSSGREHIFYVMIRNVTKEKRHLEEISESEMRFRFASEQANIYAWEYDVVTKEMRPCFRCMRDLGLPPLVENYPEPAIEAGIFPPDYADMYRDWHRRIEKGEKTLEAIIPLTVGRVPFHVRYTTEFDEAGHPVKAYGSATLVV